MTELPADLIPLPTMPFDERPAALPLNIEECRTALWLCRGNISEAAKRLKTTPVRLRAFVKGSPRLSAEVEEARQQLVDIAEDVAYDALTDEADPGRRDQMARFVMGNLGKDRGYGSGNSGVTLNLPKGRVQIQWADGSSLSADTRDEKVIEHG